MYMFIYIYIRYGLLYWSFSPLYLFNSGSQRKKKRERERKNDDRREICCPDRSTHGLMQSDPMARKCKCIHLFFLFLFYLLFFYVRFFPPRLAFPKREGVGYVFFNNTTGKESRYIGFLTALISDRARRGGRSHTNKAQEEEKK